MVNSRMHSLTFTRIFYSKSSLVSTFSTHKKASENTREKFNMNPGEKQAEIYTYEAPWLIYACNWSVRRLRSFCCLCVVHIALYVALFLSLTLCLWCDGIPIGSRSLFSVMDPNYIHDVVYFILYTRQIIRARFNWHQQMLFLSPTLSCDKRDDKRAMI